MEHIGKILEHYPRTYGPRRRSSLMIDDDIIKSCEDMKDRIGYSANPHCGVCRGTGVVHPLTGDGKVDYSQVIDCPTEGCIVDQKRIYQSTQPAAKEKGVTKFNTFENFKPVLGAETTVEAFKDIAFNEGAPPLLMVYGVTGSGKTHLCEATVAELSKRGIDCRLWAVADLVSKLHESISENTTELLMSSLKKLPALILDDWGQHRDSLWEEQKLEEIVLARERVELITIITSNLEPPAPGEEREKGQVPERVVSRFRDKSQARLILNAAPDYRPKKKAKRSKK